MENENAYYIKIMPRMGFCHFSTGAEWAQLRRGSYQGMASAVPLLSETPSGFSR
jgi:hypothetical protein